MEDDIETKLISSSVKSPQYSDSPGSKSRVLINEAPPYQDKWALGLWGLCLLVLSGFSVALIPRFQLLFTVNSPFAVIPGSLVGLVFLLVATTLSMLAGYLFLMKKFAKQLILATLVIPVVFNVVFSSYLLFNSSNKGSAMAYLVVSIAIGAIAYRWRNRIPLAAILMTIAADVASHYHGTLLLSFAIALAQCGAYIWTIVCVMGLAIDQQITHGQGAYGIQVFLVFAFAWNSQVLKNILHVTVSGAFASYYFTATAMTDLSSPTVKALKRTVTTSLGSVCYGSLLTAVIETLFAILGIRRDRSNMTTACFQCCFGSILEFLQLFNHYAFTQVAIYGKDFCTASKDTWGLVKSRGLDMVINDCLIRRVAVFCVMLSGIVCGLVSYLFVTKVQFFSIAIGTEADESTIAYYYLLHLLVIIYSAVLGVILTTTVLEVVKSGAATTLVCLAEDPEALKRTKPELLETILATYPQISWTNA